MLDIITIQVTPEEARKIKTALITRAMHLSKEYQYDRDRADQVAQGYNELYEKVHAQTSLGVGE